MSMRPTYQALPSYDHLMPRASGEDIVLVKQGATLPHTVRAIRQVMEEEGGGMARIAEHLRGDTPEQSAFNVWHFAKHNLTYKLDPDNWEDVRRPARTWADRFKGVDCEDYSLFIAAIMAAMGHADRMAFAIVKIAPSGKYGHIYPMLMPARAQEQMLQGTSSGTALDILLGYNQHASKIQETMQLRILGGIEAPADDLGAVRQALSAEDQAKYMWLKLAPAADRPLITELLPHVARVTPGGGVIWKPGTDIEELNALAADFEVERSLGLSGLGAVSRRQQRQQERRLRRDDKKKDGDKRPILSSVARVMPVMIAGRTVYLELIRLNAFQLARLLRLVFIKEEEAKRLKLNIPEWRKLSARREKVEKAWIAVGGDLDKLKKAIAKGAKANVATLGDPGTAVAGAAGAIPVIVAIATAVGGDHDLKKVTEGTSEEDLARLGASAGKAIEGAITKIKERRKDRKDAQAEKDAQALVPEYQEDPAPGGAGNNRETTDTKDNTMYWVAGLLLLTGGGYYAYTQSQKKTKAHGRSKKG